jgi:predicted metal-dependent phosphoesterase TrpH
MRADFHTHTTLSDGRVSPEALVFKACARGLDVVAVTDHDTTAGVAAALAEGEAYGVHVVTGVELSVALDLDGETLALHLICLGFDLDDPDLQALMARIRASRGAAARETLARLSLAGYAATLPAHLLETSDQTLCRPHLADALVRAGHARSRNDAFDRYLASDTYRSPYDLPSAEEALRVVHRAGGLAVWAHPRVEELDRAAPVLTDLGLDGLEVFRASFKSSPRGLYAEEVARHHGLLIGGGSDAHGLVIGELGLGEEQVGPLVRTLI